MSIWKFNDFEAEIDVTDADFIEKIENSGIYELDDSFEEKNKKLSELYREKCNEIDNILIKIFGKDCLDDLFHGKQSFKVHTDCLSSFMEFVFNENTKLENEVEKKRKVLQKYSIK